jgi:asparagine synthase (glutamine-hydrolysing)
LSPLLKANAISKKLSIDGISEYFRYGSIQQPNTIFAEAYYLMPGHFMRVNTDKSCTFEQYYDYATRGKIAVQEYSYQEAVGNLRRELDIATQYHLVSDVNVGAFLSGGVDSSAVVAMMKRSSTAQVNTFSIGFKHASEVEDETDIASRTAKYLGCNHRNIKIDDAYVSNIFDGFIDSLDQPTIDGINTFIVSLETAKEMKVALSGLGGDEIFAGYSHFSQITESSNISNKSHLVLLKKLHDLRPNRFTNRFQFVGISPEQGVDEKRVLDRQLSKTLKNHAMIEGLSKSMELSTIQRISKAEIDGYMLNTLLRDNDVLSMANSLEVRPILLDHKVVEAVFMLPDNFKIRNNLSKAIFIDSVKDMIPEEVWRREKSGFDMPLGHWMNSCLNVKFVQLMELPIAKEIFCARYRMKLSSRVLAKKAIRNDWMAFIFLAWAERHEVEI